MSARSALIERLERFKKYGLAAEYDMNPTMDYSTVWTVGGCFQEYMQRMSATVKELATESLDAISRSEKSFGNGTQSTPAVISSDKERTFDAWPRYFKVFYGMFPERSDIELSPAALQEFAEKLVEEFAPSRSTNARNGDTPRTEAVAVEVRQLIAESPQSLERLRIASQRYYEHARDLERELAAAEDLNRRAGVDLLEMEGRLARSSTSNEPADATAWWGFVEAALQKEYERAAYPEAMFPQVAEDIAASRRALLSAIKTVQFAGRTKQALPPIPFSATAQPFEFNVKNLEAWPPAKQNQRQFVLPEDVIWQLQTTLAYYAAFDTWHGERTGGVLQGCPRGAPSIHDDQGKYAGEAYLRLTKLYPLKEVK